MAAMQPAAMQHVLGLLHAQLDSPRPKRRMVEALVKLLLTQGSLPDDEIRVKVWSVLLGSPQPQSKGAGAEVWAADTAAVDAVIEDLPNQRVVHVDAERTRPDIPAFRGMVGRITRLLTYYCKTGYTCASANARTSGGASGEPVLAPAPVKYKQGLNEVLAPFLMLGLPEDGPDGGPPSRAFRSPPPALGAGAVEPTGSGPHALPDVPPGLADAEAGAKDAAIGTAVLQISDGAVMALFSRMVARFAPRLYACDDDEFVSLQCSMRLFRLLLQHHDPELCKVLDQYDVVPELYATPWFLTLFARSLSRPMLFQAWDFLVVCCRKPGPAVLHTMALAFLISHR
jgi:hypothetical protein